MVNSIICLSYIFCVSVLWSWCTIEIELYTECGMLKNDVVILFAKITCLATTSIMYYWLFSIIDYLILSIVYYLAILKCTFVHHCFCIVCHFICWATAVFSKLFLNFTWSLVSFSWIIINLSCQVYVIFKSSNVHAWLFFGKDFIACSVLHMAITKLRW